MGTGRDFTLSGPDSGDVRLLIDGKMGMRPNAEARGRHGAANLRLSD